MADFIRILRSPLIGNQYAPLRRDLPPEISLQQAIAAAKSYGEEMGQSFSYFLLNDIEYRAMEGGIFEMDSSNRPKRKVADYQPPTRKQERHRED
jgi:hypothetical protein